MGQIHASLHFLKFSFPPEFAPSSPPQREPLRKAGWQTGLHDRLSHVDSPLGDVELTDYH